MTSNEFPFSFTKPPAYRSFESIPPNARLTRRQVAELLTECGAPAAEKTLSTKACRGGGPPYSLFGKVAVYTWADAVEWAIAQLGEPASNASEHKARRTAAGDLSKARAREAMLHTCEKSPTRRREGDFAQLSSCDSDEKNSRPNF
jgi:hypothetical protein